MNVRPVLQSAALRGAGFGKSFSWVLFVAAAVVILLGSSQARASILWGPATGISADSDVDTTGSLVAAYNIGGPGVPNTAVNGVTFTGLALTGTTVSDPSGHFTFVGSVPFGSSNSVGGSGAPGQPFTNLSPGYQVLVSSTAGTVGAGTSFTLTMTGLTSGDNYRFEWWSSDCRDTSSSTQAADGGTVALASRSPDQADQGMVGQFAIGTFTANSLGTEQITFTNVGGFPEDLIDAFELRDTSSAVPEPSSVVMLSIGAIGMLGYVWRRSRLTRG